METLTREAILPDQGQQAGVVITQRKRADCQVNLALAEFVLRIFCEVSRNYSDVWGSYSSSIKARDPTRFGIVSMALGISMNVVRNLEITGMCRNLKKYKSLHYP